MHNPEIVLENKTHKLHWNFEIQISTRRPDLIIINKNERTCRIVVLVGHRVKLKECGKWDKYLDLARELKKLWNMKVMIIIGVLGTVTKGLIQGLKDLKIMGRVKTIKSTALLRSARTLRRARETWRGLMSFRLQWGTISWRLCEGLSRIEIIYSTFAFLLRLIYFCFFNYAKQK